MKRILFLGCFVVVGLILVCAAGLAFQTFLAGKAPVAMAAASAPEICPPPRNLPPLPDVDALAARMKHNQDIYQKLRDAAFVAYAKLHPMAKPFDDEARMDLRLFACLLVWGDFYGEGLWSKLSDHVDNIDRKGCKDPTWRICYEANIFEERRYSVSENFAAELNQVVNAYQSTTYPPLFKISAYKRVIQNLIQCKADPEVKLGESYAGLPDFARRAVGEYQHLIEANLSHSFLYRAGNGLLSVADADEPTLKTISMGLDRAFEAVDPDNPVGDALDGVFYTSDAWCARGTGYANTVTPQAWQLFRERLERANSILSGLEAKAPGEWMTADAMMTVMRGQEQPRDQMELWFQRGIKADPDAFGMYMHKRVYLLPRWYGSDDDEWNFGTECAQSQNWAAKIPMMLVEAVSDAGDRDPTIYGRDETWAPLEKVYRAYLQKYPDSSNYRSRFAKSAVQGEHWDVAKEQFKILGDNWDRSVFDDSEYASMSAAAKAH